MEGLVYVQLNLMIRRPISDASVEKVTVANVANTELVVLVISTL